MRKHLLTTGIALSMLVALTCPPAFGTKPVSITIFQDKSPAKQLTAPKSGPEFIDWWIARALDYDIETSANNITLAEKFMDLPLFQKFADIFINAKTKNGFVGNMAFVPSAQCRYWSTKSGIKIRVDGTLIDLYRSTMPFQHVALLFDVATTSGKPKITNFEVIDDKDGANANNFLKQAVKTMEANCYTKNVECLVHYRLGLKFAEAENWAQAKVELDKAAQTNPKFALVYFDRSRILQKLAIKKTGQTYSMRRADKDQHLTDLNKAIELAPNFASAYVNRSHLRRFNEGPEGMTADLNQAIKINPKFAEAYYFRFSAGNGGPIPTDFSDLDKAVELDPLYAEVFTARAILKSYVNDYAGALKDLNQAVTIDPEWTQPYCERAALKYQMKDKKGSMEDLTKAIQADKKNCDAYLFRGYLKMELGDKKGALEDFSASIKAYDDFVFPYIARIEARKALGETDSAEDYKKLQDILASNANHENTDYATGFHMLPQVEDRSVFGKTQFPHKEFKPGITVFSGSRSERKHPSEAWVSR
jgi:tetratricopeptide (TPR) repeat protein